MGRTFDRTTRWLASLLFAALATSVPAAPLLPAAPDDYVLDDAGVLSHAQRSLLAHDLRKFERETSNQLVVAVFPKVPDDYAMEDFTQRVAEEWGVGGKDRENGMVLFVFPESRQLRVEVGYGLEGVVPDAMANRIINEEIIPSFRAGDLGGGTVKGADALMAAARGEYEGTGQTMAEGKQGRDDPGAGLVFWIILIIVLIVVMQRSHGSGGTVYTPRGRRDVFFPGGGFGGGGFGGGGGGGGFSGGGGGFGGGGASGRW